MFDTVYLYDNTKPPNLTSYQSSLEIYGSKTLSNVLVHYCINQCSNININDIQIKKDSFGKPYLDNNPSIHFNISHSKNVIICIVSQSPIGIDVEKTRGFLLTSKMKVFFSEDEWISLCSNDKDRFTFFELWTCKESYSKFLGLGLRRPFSSFSVSKNNNNYTIKDLKNEKLPKLSSYLYNKEYYITVCSEKKIEVTIREVSSEILRKTCVQLLNK